MSTHLHFRCSVSSDVSVNSLGVEWRSRLAQAGIKCRLSATNFWWKVGLPETYLDIDFDTETDSALFILTYSGIIHSMMELP